jgi:hypothetical protein
LSYELIASEGKTAERRDQVSLAKPDPTAPEHCSLAGTAGEAEELALSITLGTGFPDSTSTSETVVEIQYRTIHCLSSCLTPLLPLFSLFFHPISAVSAKTVE